MVHPSAVDNGRRRRGGATGNEMRRKVREAVAAFDDARAMQGAVGELERYGFNQALMSVLTSPKTARDKLGCYIQGRGQARDERRWLQAAAPDAIGPGEGNLISGLMAVGALTTAGAVLVPGSGSVAAALLGVAVVGGRALAGSVLARMLGKKQVSEFDEQLARGRIFLWVHLRDMLAEQRAMKALLRHHPTALSVHDIDLSRGVRRQARRHLAYP